MTESPRGPDILDDFEAFDLVAEEAKEPTRAKTRPLWLLRLQAHLPSSVRRERHDMIAAATRDREGGRPWFGEGVLVTHFAIGLFHPVSLCLREVGAVQNTPPRTLIGLTCRRCARLHRRAVRDYLTAEDTSHTIVEAKVEGKPVLVCRTCTRAANPVPNAPAYWPCVHASAAEREAAEPLRIAVEQRLAHAAERRAFYDATYHAARAAAADPESPSSHFPAALEARRATLERFGDDETGR